MRDVCDFCGDVTTDVPTCCPEAEREYLDARHYDPAEPLRELWDRDFAHAVALLEQLAKGVEHAPSKLHAGWALAVYASRPRH